MLGIHARQEKFLNPPYYRQQLLFTIIFNTEYHVIICWCLTPLLPIYFLSQIACIHSADYKYQPILTYSPCFLNSQIKTKEHYVIWYLMIIEMLHINLAAS